MIKPQCLILDPDDNHARQLAQVAEACGFTPRVAASLEEYTGASKLDQFDLIFVDLDCPENHAVFSLADGSLPESIELFVMTAIDEPGVADAAIRRGASYYFCKPLDAVNIQPLLEDMAAEFAADRVKPDSSGECGIDQFGMLRGSSRGMRKLYRQIRKVAPSDASVMVVGESGTGKELVAQTLHMLSPRRDGPFVAFNCAAVPENLAESELFGHEKGSFSGAARRHQGYFERASGGTLLLDEISEMHVDLQAKLLRVLETRKLRRLGAESEVDADVRIISACNRSPEDAVRDGLLREDVYYRLAQFPLKVPPLRRRGTDIGGLAQHFLRELNEQHATSLAFSAAALDSLQKHSWPGNVRELKHLVERAYILSEEVIDQELQSAIDDQTGTLESSDNLVAVPIGTSIAQMEQRLILATLEHTGDDKQAAADILGVSLKTLYNRLKEYAGEAQSDAS